MSVPVILKSGKNYMTLVLDSEIEYVSLVQEIVNKFHSSEKFFGNEPIALHFEGRKLSEKEKLQIMDAIEEFTSVKIGVLVENDRLAEYASNDLLVKKLYPEEYEKEQLYPECHFIVGDVESGQKINGTKDVVITGNVRKGGSVMTPGSIIVLGALLGQAIAGVDGDEDATISATVFAPENYRICDVIGELPKNNKKYAMKLQKYKSKSCPQVAMLSDGEIVIQNLTDFI